MRVFGLVMLCTLAACVRRSDIATEVAAMREQLGEYQVVEIIADMANGETTNWAAYFDEDGDVRYIRERSRRGESELADSEYWFDSRRIIAYRSHATPPDAEEVVIYLGFDRAGGLAEKSKSVEGSPERVQPAEVAAAKDRAAFLRGGAERALTRQAGVTTPMFTVSPSVPGRLTLEGAKLRFVRCGENGRGVVLRDLPDDRGAALVRELGGAATVRVRLEEDRLREIRYAAAEGPGCDRLSRDGDVEASGNEPFWSLRVDGSEAVLRTPDDLDGAVFRDVMWTRSGEGWVFRARRGGAAGVTHLTMELTEARCIDEMSGARYPMKAVVTREEDRVEGCAVEKAGRAGTEAR
jgi:uncharacterized membrane protein